jgi:hypothetical protein
MDSGHDMKKIEELESEYSVAGLGDLDRLLA